MTFGLSLTLAVDTSGELALVVTPEFGFGTPGASAFARLVVSPDANSTVEDLYGDGISLSGSFGQVSGSITFPGSPLGDAAPILEFEYNLGTSGMSATVGRVMTPSQFIVWLKERYRFAEILVTLGCKGA